ncbi:MAG: Uma2 family endonuclease [Phaeodactylibacter sp.]|nr:Uma2 family endonuclease [Phaeodactylibacter sp.]
MESAIQKIPDHLIYEMIDGDPIYYKGYRDYLNGNKQIEELMGSSILQSLIISRLVFLLQSNLGPDYEVLTNEVGIQVGVKAWRAADIAIVKTREIEGVESKNKYLGFAPEVVIEIDTKAELTEIKNPLSYYHEKTDELLKFGVKKVIWIFTETRKVMVAQKDKKWETSDWKENIFIIEAIELQIDDLLKKRN